MMRFFVLLLCIIASTTAFTTPPCAVSSTYTARSGAATAGHLNVMQSPRFMKPTSLGVRLNGEDEEVKVVTMEVDPFTLTAVGFGLIAFNFLVLANMGDAGIGGIVARIMNTFG